MLAKGVGSGGEEVACAGAAWNTTSPATQPGGKYVLRKDRISTRVEDAFSSFWIMAVRVKGHLAASTKHRVPKPASTIARLRTTSLFFIHESCCGGVPMGMVACMGFYIGCRGIVIERHSRPAPGCTQLVQQNAAALLESPGSSQCQFSVQTGRSGWELCFWCWHLCSDLFRSLHRFRVNKRCHGSTCCWVRWPLHSSSEDCSSPHGNLHSIGGKQRAGLLQSFLPSCFCFRSLRTTFPATYLRRRLLHKSVRRLPILN